VEGREFDAVGPLGLEGSLLQAAWVRFDSDRSFRYLAILGDKVYLVRNWAMDR